MCVDKMIYVSLLLASLPTLAGWCGGGGGGGGWCARGEVVAVTEGAGPAFAPRQRTDVLAAVGQAATLECRVLRLGDKAVSWVRSRDLHILAHAGGVFTADARVSAGAAGGRHALQLQRLRPSDAGRYECQINTEPKMSLFFNLTVVDEAMPATLVEALGARAVRGARGGAATLACEARYEPPPRALPLPPLDIRWLKDGETISAQGARGGVSLDTERWAARAVSRLTLAELRMRDAGRYTCAAAGRAATLRLVVDAGPALDADADADADADQPGGQLEAMQRDQSSASGARCAGCAGWAGWSGCAGRTLLALLPLLVCSAAAT